MKNKATDITSAGNDTSEVSFPAFLWQNADRKDITLVFFLHRIQTPEKHISDSRIIKPLRLDFSDLIQTHGADSLNGRLTLRELPAARLAAGSVDRIIGQEDINVSSINALYFRTVFRLFLVKLALLP